jgi:hypothetical protein
VSWPRYELSPPQLDSNIEDTLSTGNRPVYNTTPSKWPLHLAGHKWPDSTQGLSCTIGDFLVEFVLGGGGSMSSLRGRWACWIPSGICGCFCVGSCWTSDCASWSDAASSGAKVSQLIGSETVSATTKTWPLCTQVHHISHTHPKLSSSQVIITHTHTQFMPTICPPTETDLVWSLSQQTFKRLPDTANPSIVWLAIPFQQLDIYISKDKANLLSTSPTLFSHDWNVSFLAVASEGCGSCFRKQAS